MQNPNTYTARIVRRLKNIARGALLGLFLLPFETAFRPHEAEALPPVEPAPFGDTRAELLRALDKHAAKRLGELERVMLADLTAQIAHKHGVDPMLLLAVMSVESEFKESARSSVGALGFMQLMNPTAFEWMGRMKQPMHELGLFDWSTNIELGAVYLRHLHDRLGSWPMALAAYNWGPTKVIRAVRANGSLPRKMRAYERRVSSAYQSLATAAGHRAAAALAFGPAHVRDAI